MTLYHYDHCPYCVKARMIFGFKQVPHELKALANDDEHTPNKLIGKKMLPILTRPDGEHMGESLDIISYVDNMSEYGAPIVGESRNDLRLQKWLQDARQYHYALAMPRWVRMGLPEFATESAVQYFVGKKTSSIGSFEDRVKQTPELIEMAHRHLQQLEKLLPEEGYIWGDLTYDDIHLFATLRVMTTVSGLEFPPKVDNYAKFVSDRAQVPLHWGLAI